MRETPAEDAKPEEKEAEKAKEKAAEGQTVTTPAVNAAKDVWIDNTEDKSTSIIYSVIKELDESTGQGDYTYSFKEQIPVTFSNPRPQAVEDAINEVTEELKETAKERGFKVYSIYEDTPTVKVWDNRKYETIEEIAHDHDLVKTEEAKATCETDGTEAFWTCSICGRMFSDEKGSTEIEKPVTIPASGHSCGDWVVTKEPTEEEAGEKTRTCKVDPDHKETVSIPALEKEEEPAVEEDKDDEDDKNNEVTAPEDNKKNNSTSPKKTSSKHSKKSSKKSSSKAKSPKTGDRSVAYFRAFMTMALFLGMICAVLAGRNKIRHS